MKMKRILTYGTFDLLHYGHIRLLKRAKAMGTISLLPFQLMNLMAGKGKKAYTHMKQERKCLKQSDMLTL